jgi:hypothetical protein
VGIIRYSSSKKKPAGKGGYLPVEGGESKGAALLSLSNAVTTSIIRKLKML